MNFPNRIIVFSRILSGLAFVMVGAVLADHAQAQRCVTDQQAIIKLSEANLGAYAVWHGVHGNADYQHNYVDGFLLPDGDFFVVGAREFVGADVGYDVGYDVGQAVEKAVVTQLLLRQIDARGRVVWENHHDIKSLTRVLQVRSYADDGVVVSALVHDESLGHDVLWLGFFDMAGEFKFDKKIKNDAYHFDNAYFVAHQDEVAFVVGVVDHRAHSDAAIDMPGYTMFYRVDAKGNVIAKRSFNTGADNRLQHLSIREDGNLIASGYINNTRGRKNGWLVQFDAKGNMMWQRQYPRGLGGVLGVSASRNDNDDVILVAGYSAPALATRVTSGPQRAGWLMAVDASNGDEIWERFYTAQVDYTAVGILVNDDNVASVVLNAGRDISRDDQYAGEDNQQYVRLISVNPRGVILSSDAFFEGVGAKANAIILSNADNRVILGRASIAYKIKPDGSDVINDVDETDFEPETVRRDSGWIVAASSVSPYHDPCGK